MEQNIQKTGTPKKKPFFSLVMRFLRLFYRKPKFTFVCEKIEQPSIIISNHASLKGPMLHEMYMPVSTAKWGAGEMLENYKTRYNYLRNVFYMQKKGYGKVRATLFAIVAAAFSKFFYKGMNVIPTWQDTKILDTFSKSMAALNGGTSILIFPENSDEGYKEFLTQFYSGFVALAELYYRKNKIRLPVYPVYYHKRSNRMIVGEAHFVQDFAEQGLSREQIADEFRKIVNGLYEKYAVDDKNNQH